VPPRVATPPTVSVDPVLARHLGSVQSPRSPAVDGRILEIASICKWSTIHFAKCDSVSDYHVAPHGPANRASR